MDKQVAELFSRHSFITEPVKKYFINKGLTSIDAIKEIPVTDMQSLPEYLNGCPNVGNLGVRRALWCLIEEIRNTVKEAEVRNPSILRHSESMNAGSSNPRYDGKNRFTLYGDALHRAEDTPPGPIAAPRKKNINSSEVHVNNPVSPKHNKGRRALTMRDNSNAIEKEGYLYALPKVKVVEDTGFRKLRIGPDRIGQISDKVILIVGGTGSGKSTFVNALANYLYDVDFNDPFRFQLITAKDERKEAGTTEAGKSKTKVVSAYELTETRLRYRLTIVDTPGFGDTEGINRDKETEEYIRKWFQRKDEHGLKTIDAVCIVIKGTETRVTAEMKHKLYSVHSLFDRKMTANIITVFTFCDVGEPPAKNALATDRLLLGDTQLLFNSIGATEMNKGEEQISAIYHAKCWSNFTKLFEKLDKLEPHSLVYASEVLQNRKSLEEKAVDLSDQITQLLASLEQLGEFVKLLQTECSPTHRISSTQSGTTFDQALEEICAKYGIDRKDKNYMDSLLERLGLDLVEKEKKLGDTVTSVRENLNKLNAIAMRPEQATDSQYLQYLIDTLDKTTTVANYSEQRAILRNHLKIVKLLEAVQNGQSLFHVSESAAVAYLGRTYPNLYKKLRLLGHFPTNNCGDDNHGKTAEVAEENAEILSISKQSSQDEQERISLNSEVPSEGTVNTELEELNRMIDQVSLSSETAADTNPPTLLPPPRVPIWKRFTRFIARNHEQR